eukprot:COSAG06_NODE_690_length_13054_cov_5.226476_18_plen_322_part_00
MQSKLGTATPPVSRVHARYVPTWSTVLLRTYYVLVMGRGRPAAAAGLMPPRLLLLLLLNLLLQTPTRVAGPQIGPLDPYIGREGRWHIAGGGTGGDDSSGTGTEPGGGAAAVLASADWPCSGLHFEVDSPSSGGNVTVHWLGLRTRLVATVSGQPPVILSGPAVEPLPQMPAQHDTLRLPAGRATVRLRKLTQATPFSMGIGRILGPSVLQFHGLSLQPARARLTATREPVRRRIEFIGASDTAGYCVDGTPNTTSIGDTLFGWELSNCDSAYPGVLGRSLGAAVSVQVQYSHTDRAFICLHALPNQIIDASFTKTGFRQQ